MRARAQRVHSAIAPWLGDACELGSEVALGASLSFALEAVGAGCRPVYRTNGIRFADGLAFASRDRSTFAISSSAFAQTRISRSYSSGTRASAGSA